MFDTSVFIRDLCVIVRCLFGKRNQATMKNRFHIVMFIDENGLVIVIRLSRFMALIVRQGIGIDWTPSTTRSSTEVLSCHTVSDIIILVAFALWPPKDRPCCTHFLNREYIRNGSFQYLMKWD